jgi:hypothetical protein
MPCERVMKRDPKCLGEKDTVQRAALTTPLPSLMGREPVVCKAKDDLARVEPLVRDKRKSQVSAWTIKVSDRSDQPFGISPSKRTASTRAVCSAASRSACARIEERQRRGGLKTATPPLMRRTCAPSTRRNWGKQPWLTALPARPAGDNGACTPMQSLHGADGQPGRGDLARRRPLRTHAR